MMIRTIIVLIVLIVIILVLMWFAVKIDFDKKALTKQKKNGKIKK